MNPYNWRLDYGNSNWDIRHRSSPVYVYELPLFRSARGILRAALATGQINGITTLQSGLLSTCRYRPTRRHQRRRDV